MYRWVINAAAPRLDVSGTFLGYIGSVIDITERKQAEGAMQQLAAIVESSDDAIVGKARRSCSAMKLLRSSASR
jgi:hypothetical protein